MRLVVEGTPTPPSQVDLPLLKAVARGYRWSDDLLSGRVHSVAEIAEREGISGRAGNGGAGLPQRGRLPACR